MVSVGFLTNLDALLRSGPDEDSPLDGVELVRRKVKQWVCMGGRFPASTENGEFNLATYPEATAYVLAHWPTPSVFSGFEIGVQVKTGARLIREHPPATSPVSRAYLEYTGGKDRESWDQTAALYAVRGLGHEGQTYFTAVDRGHLRFVVAAALPRPPAGAVGLAERVGRGAGHRPGVPGPGHAARNAGAHHRGPDDAPPARGRYSIFALTTR